MPTPAYSSKESFNSPKMDTFLSGSIKWIVVGLIMLILFGWLGISTVSFQMKDRLREELNTVLKANVEAIKLWMEQQKINVNNWAQTPEVSKNIVSLSKKLQSGQLLPEDLLYSPELATLRALLRPICEHYGFIGFVAFDSSGMQVAALLDDPLGQSELMKRSDFFARSLQGETLVSLPFRGEVPLPDSKGQWRLKWPTMFSSAPVRDESGKIVGVFSFRIRPEKEFTRFLEISRSGKSGETFAFDSKGTLLSDSRFYDKLVSLKLIDPELHPHAILNIQLRDPGSQSSIKNRSHPRDQNEWPLTRMAASAVLGKSGIELDGYNSYRGTIVVGAWTWLPEYHFGIATELDVNEAYLPLVTLNKLFVLFMVLLCLVSLLALNWRRSHFIEERNRQLAEHSLKMSELENRSILANALDPIISVNSQGVIETFNKAAENCFGYNPIEILGKSVLNLLTENYRQRFSANSKSNLESIINQLLGQTVEITGVNKVGLVIPIELRVSEMNLGNEKKYIGIFRDISRQKAIDESLMKKNSYVKLLQNVAVASNEAKTLEGAAQSCLEYICDTIDWPLGHLVLSSRHNLDQLESSKIWLVRDSLTYRDFMNQSENKIFKVGEGLPGRVLEKGSPEFVSDFSSNPQLNEIRFQSSPTIRAGLAFPVFVGKEIVAVLEFFSDQPMECDPQFLEVLVHASAQLGRVVERIRSEEELRHYASDLERSNQELKDFTFVVSHDLQEPLRKIQTFGDLFYQKMKSKLDGTSLAYLERMMDSSRRMRDFINDFLAYTKITSDPYEMGTLDLNEVVGLIVKTFRDQLESVEGNITMESLPQVRAASFQIDQLFKNLIGNGIKYRHPERPLEIRIKSRNLSAERVEIVVEDNGIGFDQRFKSRIFKPFQRLHRRKEIPGTGMGLTVCQKIVQILGGTIRAEGIPNQGSKFILTLPKIIEDNEESHLYNEI